MIKIVVANKKGGVGKTTTVQNLGYALARKGKKVILLDMDPQGNLTTASGITPASSILDVLRKNKTIEEVALPLYEVKVKKTVGSVSLIPAIRELAAMPELFASDFGKEMLLKESLEHLEGYDYLLIDSPPVLDLLAVNTYVASDYVLIPVQCEFFSLEGLHMMQNDIERVKARLNPNLKILGIMPTFYDKRKRICRDVVNLLQERYSALITKTTIRDNVALAEAPSNAESIFDYDSTCYGSKDYESLGEEIIKIMEKNHA